MMSDSSGAISDPPEAHTKRILTSIIEDKYKDLSKLLQHEEIARISNVLRAAIEAREMTAVVLEAQTSDLIITDHMVNPRIGTTAFFVVEWIKYDNPDFSLTWRPVTAINTPVKSYYLILDFQRVVLNCMGK
jgi:hypothetical protein